MEDSGDGDRRDSDPGFVRKQNMKMHCIMTVLVVLAGFSFEIRR